MSERDYLKGVVSAMSPGVKTKGKTTDWLRGYINASMGSMKNFGNNIMTKVRGSIFGGRQAFGGLKARFGYGHIPFGGHSGFHVPHSAPHHGCGHKFTPYFS